MNTCQVCGQTVALADSGRGGKSWVERHVSDGKVCAGSFRAPRHTIESGKDYPEKLVEKLPPAKSSDADASDAVEEGSNLVDAANATHYKIAAGRMANRRSYKTRKPRQPSDAVSAFVLEDGEGTLWGTCVNRYFPLNQDIQCESTERYYRRAIKLFGVYLGRQPLLSDLNDDQVLMWLKALLQSGKNRVNTKREQVGRILTLWRWCAETRLVEKFPRVRRPREQESIPHAWTVEQLARLFKAASEEIGYIGGIPAADWWSAWLAFVFWTAERKSAAMAVRWEWVDLDRGVVSIPAEVRKGKVKNGIYHLEPEVVSLLRKIRKSDIGVYGELVFPTDRPSMYWLWWNRILKRAGLPTGRKYKTHCLRATHATIRTVLGGDATKALMHSDPQTTRKHYIDPTHLPADSVKLPTPWAHNQPPAAHDVTVPASVPERAPFNNSAVIAMELPADEARALPRARRVAG